jgi:hypothetical protein
MTRTLARSATDDVANAGEQFAAATALLPSTDGLAKFKSWLVEGCRATQPLEAFAGNLVADAIEIAPGAVVSVQATIDMPSGPVLIGAPVLVGRNGERSSLLVAPLFSD